MRERIYHYLGDIQAVLHVARNECYEDIESAAQLITTCFQSSGKLLICGNGGSAAQAQHMAAELIPSNLPALALTTDTSFLTAWSNDVGFDSVFAQQVEALGKEEDVLLAISTSGRSPNIRNAVRCAQRKGLGVIGLTGNNTDVFLDATIAIRVPSDHIQHIQEAHLAICHIICELVIKEMQS